MLNEEKIRLMISLAEYEKGQGRVDLQRAGYYKIDYVRTRVLRTVACVKVASILLFMLFCFYHAETWLMNVFSMDYTAIGGQLLTIFLLLQILFVVITIGIENIQYEESMKRVKVYFRNLNRLMEYYKEEESP